MLPVGPALCYVLREDYTNSPTLQKSVATVVARPSWGRHRRYRDKRGRGIFYYNRVSRVSQFEVPDDYEKDRSYIMKDATFGMHFYH